MPRKSYRSRNPNRKRSYAPKRTPYIADKKMSKANKALTVASYGVKAEPFPRVLYTRCKYATRLTLTQSIGADVAASNTFRLNSIYDPDFTGSGRTVAGHANLANIYDQYWVMGAKVKVMFNDATVDGCRVGCRLRINGNNATSGENVRALMESPLTYMSGLNDTGSQKKTFSFYVRPWSLVGCSKLEYMANSSTYSSAIASNPAASSTCLLDVFVVNPNQTAASTNVVVQIIYYTKLYSRKELQSSAF